MPPRSTLLPALLIVGFIALTLPFMLAQRATPAAPLLTPLLLPILDTQPLMSNVVQSMMTAIVAPPDGSDRLFITEKRGVVQVTTRTNGTWATPTLFLDMSALVSTEKTDGLLSIAFPPTYAQSRNFYVKYTNLQRDVVIARYRTRADDPNLADPASGQIVLVIEQPDEPFPVTHRGGQIQFGNDGMLYIGTGDGGFGTQEGDPLYVAQNPQSLLGKMLRIDVESNQPTTYSIPPDNPFVNNPAYRPEIWQLGLRNPFRFSFDSATGDLYIADVGHQEWEEINVIAGSSNGGENLGWSCYEGEYIYKPCAAATFTRPAWVYPHAQRHCAVIGGYVYRGTRYPRLQGMYLYADYCTGGIYGMRSQNGVWQSVLLYQAGNGAFTTFGVDRDGEIVAGAFELFALYDRGIEPMIEVTPSITPPPSPTLFYPHHLYLPVVKQRR